MSRPGSRGGGCAGGAAVLLLALLAACVAPEDGSGDGTEDGAEAAAATAAGASEGEEPAGGQGILGLDASELMAEVEPGTGRIALMRRTAPAPGEEAELGPFARIPEGEGGAAAAAGGETAAARRRRPPPDPAAERELAETRRDLGLALEGAGDIAGAVSEFEAALAARWARGEAETPWADLARLCRRGEPAGAVARACTRVLDASRFAPDELAEFIANRGDAHARLGRAELAMADYRAALRIESSNFRALVGRARLNLSEGRPAAALNDLRLAIATGPRPAEARVVRARALRALGELERAVADYDAILADAAARAWHPTAWRERAEAHCAMGRPEAAAVDWQVWADSAPGRPAYVQELLRGRGYLKGPWEPGIGPATLAGLRAWTREGCP